MAALNARVVEIEPTGDVWQYEQKWNHELCDCCFKCKYFCCAYFCTCCFMCQQMKRAGECLCQPLIPCTVMAFRSKIRTAFRIEGTMCKDCCVMTFCLPCAFIQIASELDKLDANNMNGKDNGKRKR